MEPADSTRSSGRETRLLLVTMAISVCALLLLARFRFPDEVTRGTADPAPAPLERLAARGAYDELASAMADLERRLAPRLAVYRVTPQRATGAYVVAPRLTPTRAAIALGPDESLEAVGEMASPEIVSRDGARGLAFLDLPATADGTVTPRTGVTRSGPRYVVVAEGSAQGPTLRPVYVARLTISETAGATAALLSLEGLQPSIPVGAAVFALDGSFLGVVIRSGPSTSVVGGDSLRAAAETAQPTPARPQGSLGVDVQRPTDQLLRAAAADRGVIVTHVRPEGPAAKALRPGDVIQAVDDMPTDTVDAFQDVERARTPNAPITVRYVRRGTPAQVTFRAAERAGADAGMGPGFTGRGLAGVGIEVLAVDVNGPAARAGLRRGDLVLTLDGEAVSNPATLVRAWHAAADGRALLVSIERGPEHRVLALEKR